MPPDEIKVFISGRDSTCGECGEALGRHAWITLKDEKGALCLSCADLDHLVYLPVGNVALTRRARKHSALSAVVLKWSSSRKRYERLLVEQSALERAETECLSDQDARAAARERACERRAEQDQVFVTRPAERDRLIAEHACLKYSGRVGRCASAKELETEPVRLAVAAHIRHTETEYDRMLAGGAERRAARAEVGSSVDAVLRKWEHG